MSNFEATGGQTTTTTTTRVEEMGPDAPFGFKKTYLFTVPGIIKIVQMVASLCLCFCSASMWWTLGSWASFLGSFCLLASLLFFLGYLFNAIYKVPGPIPTIEMGFHALSVLLMLITGIVCAVYGSVHVGAGFAAFFSFAAVMAYGADLVMMILAVRKGEITRESYTTTTSTTTSHQAAYEPSQPTDYNSPQQY